MFKRYVGTHYLCDDDNEEEDAKVLCNWSRIYGAIDYKIHDAINSDLVDKDTECEVHQDCECKERMAIITNERVLMYPTVDRLYSRIPE